MELLQRRLIAVVFMLTSSTSCCQIFGQHFGYELYDIDTDKCCNGTLYKSKPEFRCCGSSYYNVSMNVCCGNQVLEFPENGQRRRSQMNCCRSAEGEFRSFDDTEAMCCSGRIVPFSQNQTTIGVQKYQCCGHELYIPTASRTCCNNTVVEKALETSDGRRGKNSVCCGGLGLVALEVGQECCGSEIIDASREICCKQFKYRDYGKPIGDTYKIVDFGVLVSKTLYRVHRRPAECCGLEVYDSSTEVCCDSQKLGGPMKILLRPHQMTGPVGQRAECCGDVVLNDLATQKCCDWKIPYDPISQRCCGGRTVDIIDSVARSNNNCCWQTGDFYNDETHFCCNAGVMQRNTSQGNKNLGCCMPSVY